MFNWWVFGDLMNSKACTNVYKLLNLSDLKKVAKTFFKNAIYQSEKNTLFQQNNFGPNVIYYVFWESGGPSADEVDLEVDLKSTSGRPQKKEEG